MSQSEKFLDGAIISEMKKAFDKSAKVDAGELMMSESQYRTILKMSGMTNDEIDFELKLLSDWSPARTAILDFK